MKKVMFSLVGALVAGAICSIMFWCIGRVALVFDIALYNNEEEASRNFLIFLICLFLFVIAGCIYGYRKASKSEDKNL
jgi:phosphotransferase system  glucose/maltose/N-acetylglucosamine-specific IIC component